MTPWLYVTHDGGHTWKQQLLGQLPGTLGTAATSVHYTTTPPVFFGNNGLLPIQIQGQLDTNVPVDGFLILKSTNGGASWFVDWKANPKALTAFASNDLYIESLQNAWATDENGNVYGNEDVYGNLSKNCGLDDVVVAILGIGCAGLYGLGYSSTRGHVSLLRLPCDVETSCL